MDEKIDGVRIDKWLWSVRLFKTRTKAQIACENGNIMVGKKKCKSAKILKIGDQVTINSGGFIKKIIVKDLIYKRVSAKIASELFEIM